MNLRLLFSAVILLGSTTVNAADVVFFDNFDADHTTNNASSFVQGWQVSSGSVDLDGTGFVHDELPGHGHYVDLDGSTLQAGILSNSITLSAGLTYTMSFAIAGNQRNWGNDTVDVTFGSSSQTYVIGAADPLTTKTLTFSPSSSGLYNFSFHNRGGDNRGAFLDQVSITAVPEPSTYSMLLTGLFVAGAMLRRQRQA